MDTLEEEPQILWVNTWSDAMPKIRNPTFGRLAIFETHTHPLHFPLYRFPAAIQHIRIQVALQRYFGPDEFASFGSFDAPV
jgi:hypothetical protein